MKSACAAILAVGVILGGCAPYLVYVYPVPASVASGPGLLDECTVIRREIARQQRIGDLSGVMATPLVEASVRLNVANVITGLEKRAAIEGCPA